MVLFLLCIKGELEGVDTLSLIKDANICFSVRNPLSDYETREKIVFNPCETLEQDESDREPPHHFAVKWEGSKKFSTLVVLDADAAKSALKKGKKKGKSGGEGDLPRDVKGEDNGEFVPVLAMECRGLEPYEFHALGNEFRVVSEGGTVFEEGVDLSEGDWADYDEEHDASVSISDFEAKIIAA
mmetsp:Transcript_2245/g.4821  ORF Transcript_2245/g.4821 Transcript_2245/m.4821 type:complete len:184 (-) Transcript_2245:1754-2305(-)